MAEQAGQAAGRPNAECPEFTHGLQFLRSSLQGFINDLQEPIPDPRIGLLLEIDFIPPRPEIARHLTAARRELGLPPASKPVPPFNPPAASTNRMKHPFIREGYYHRVTQIGANPDGFVRAPTPASSPVVLNRLKLMQAQLKQFQSPQVTSSPLKKVNSPSAEAKSSNVVHEKRKRWVAKNEEYIFNCEHESCGKVYGDLASLNRHIRDAKHGEKRKIAYFPEANGDPKYRRVRNISDDGGDISDSEVLPRKVSKKVEKAMPTRTRAAGQKTEQEEKIFDCDHKGCGKSYAHLVSLNRHIDGCHHGKKRKMSDFPEANGDHEYKRLKMSTSDAADGLLRRLYE
ncbi:hypothetical protein RUND412_008439 [Rhizina undulata]